MKKLLLLSLFILSAGQLVEATQCTEAKTSRNCYYSGVEGACICPMVATSE